MNVTERDQLLKELGIIAQALDYQNDYEVAHGIRIAAEYIEVRDA